MTRIYGEIRSVPCTACGERPAIRGGAANKDETKLVRLTRLCALCIAKILDAAYGWKISNNVAQGLVSVALSTETKLERRARAARERYHS